ncbi:phosphotransferase [Gordoniibacillus kamchatkensis]|uniref:Putative pyruvate, phosphate dikinase regulatory protein n=1 Tax=Gordoniibacillus kamchatkensis TaxID=1590651 RepID=A0ABR5ALV4_9BACL|nr:pyruvate, water dikinase regulatory protein [Paenibacillus sp. VKM B-2647]KIL41793.1 phosphotransferase [Paenibacillus sp. VKM B-2647]
MAASNLKVYVVSDSAGETGEAVVRAAATQFHPQQVEILRVPFVQDQRTVDKVIAAAKLGGGTIMFTLVVPELRDYLVWQAQEHNISYVDLLGPVLASLERTTGREARHQPGMLHRLDENYFKKMEAIEFAVNYDDGRDFSGVLKADIVLVGVSRTSKTPLSMFLAHKKYKVANVPLVPELQPPESLFTVPKHKVIGLKIDPAKLNRIREQRLKTLGLGANAGYANVERIHMELEYADKIMRRIGCFVIDVTDRAVEETASLVMEHIESRTMPAT